MQYLIPTEIEQRLTFILSKVPHGTHTYFLNWVKDKLDPDKNL